jgi:hypothetical protein
MVKITKKLLLSSVEVNSWVLHLVKSAQVLLVYPIIFNYLPSEQSALWMIFMLIVALQNLFDLGFQNVFIRIVSQAETGNWLLVDGAQVKGKIDSKARDALLLRIDNTLRLVYSTLTVLFLVLVLTIGTLYVNLRVAQLSIEIFSLGYWFLFIVGLITSFYNRRYTSYLIGIKLLPLVKRVESIVNIFSLTLGLGFFLCFPNLLTLIINYTCWQLILSFTFRGIYNKRKVSSNHKIQLDREILVFVWPMAWKGTISSLSSYGLVNAFALWFGSFANAKDIVSFTYALKILDSIRLFSRVPFYSNIPNLNAIRISKPYKVFFKSCLINIQRSNFIFMLLALLFYFIGFDLLESYATSFRKVDDLVWVLLCVAYYLHLNGAYHTHIYSMTNRVNSHISDSLSGIIILTILFIFFDKTGLFLFPVALIIGYGIFYTPWALFYSKKVLNKQFRRFVLLATVVPFLVSILFLIKF